MTLIHRDRKRILFVVAASSTYYAFLRPQAISLSQRYSITIAGSFPSSQKYDSMGNKIAFEKLSISRNISIFKDFIALLNLIKLMHGRKYDVVHSITPKAGLLAMIASKVSGIEHRLHLFTGQVWKTKTGPFRIILKKLDQITSRLSSLPMTDSDSQSAYLKANGFKREFVTLGSGSVNGVDFASYHFTDTVRQQNRMRLNIQKSDMVVSFVGRITEEKGVIDLIKAFSRLQSVSRLHLFLVGPLEDVTLRPKIEAAQLADPRIVLCGPSVDPSFFYSITDIFCLPSYREGFGTAILEAASAGVPTIGSNIYGIQDAIINGETGLLFSPGDISKLTSSLEMLLNNKNELTRLGFNARLRAKDYFSRDRYISLWDSLYDSILA